METLMLISNISNTHLAINRYRDNFKLNSKSASLFLNIMLPIIEIILQLLSASHPDSVWHNEKFP